MGYELQKAVISYDFSDIKSMLETKLADYENVVFTEDTKKDAKACVAELRKEKKEFQDRVKELKKEYMKPFDEFFAKTVEISDMYDVPICRITEQIEDFEQKRIEEKRKRCREIYDKYIDGYADKLPYEKVANPKWDNATYTEKMIKDDIFNAIGGYTTAFDVVTSMTIEFAEDAMKLYLNTFDIQRVVSWVKDKEETKRAVLKTAYEDVRAQAQKDAIEDLIPDTDGKANRYSYIIELTDDAKQKLDMYLDSVGIEYDCMISFE